MGQKPEVNLKEKRHWIRLKGEPQQAYSGPFIYQKDPKYRKDPEIPERPVNGSIHAQVSGGGRRFILILNNVLMSIFEYSYNK